MAARRRSVVSSRLAQKRRRRMWFIAGGCILALLILAGILAWVLRLESITIQTITVDGNEVVVADDLKESVRNELAGSFGFVIPRNSIFFYPADAIEATLKEQFPRIRTIDITYQSFDTIAVSMRERQPYALWCGEGISNSTADGANLYEAVTATSSATSTDISVDVATSTDEAVSTQRSEGCYFLDESGYIYTKAPMFTGNVYFRYYGPLSGEVAGSQYMPRDEFRRLQLLFQAFEEIGITPVGFDIREENDVAVLLATGAEIRFSRQQNLNEVLENLRTVLESKEFRERPLVELNYIDMRFGNEVYYTFSGTGEGE